MHLDRQRAGELITGQVRAVAALMGVTEASARSYLDDEIIKDTARRMLFGVADERPGADLMEAPRTVPLPLALVGITVAARAEAMQVRAANEPPDHLRDVIHHLRAGAVRARADHRRRAGAGRRPGPDPVPPGVASPCRPVPLQGILAGMRSLASLAHGTIGELTVPFNASFYIGVSTIIPILFLALAVQGTAYEDAVRTRITVLRASRQDRWLRKIAVLVMGYLFVIAVLVAGFSGEVIAINALYYGSDDPLQRGWARLTTLFLLLAVVARPAWQMAQLPFTVPRALSGEGGTGEQQESPGGGHAASPELGAGPKHETGKTGVD